MRAATRAARSRAADGFASTPSASHPLSSSSRRDQGLPRHRPPPSPRLARPLSAPGRHHCCRASSSPTASSHPSTPPASSSLPRLALRGAVLATALWLLPLCPPRDAAFALLWPSWLVAANALRFRWNAAAAERRLPPQRNLLLEDPPPRWFGPYLLAFGVATALLPLASFAAAPALLPPAQSAAARAALAPPLCLLLVQLVMEGATNAGGAAGRWAALPRILNPIGAQGIIGESGRAQRRVAGVAQRGGARSSLPPRF